MGKEHRVETPAPDWSHIDSASASATRLVVVDAAISVFRRFAFHEVTFETVAAAAGLPVGTLTEIFSNWEDLLIATVGHWNEQRMRPILPIARERGAVLFLRGIVEANIHDPALMRLLAALVNVAATPGHPMASWIFEEWDRFHSLVMMQLAADIQNGLEPETMLPARGAEQLIAMYEGLQLQSMVRSEMDLLDSYDRAVTRLRDGWTREYTPPVWSREDPVSV